MTSILSIEYDEQKIVNELKTLNGPEAKKKPTAKKIDSVTKLASEALAQGLVYGKDKGATVVTGWVVNTKTISSFPAVFEINTVPN